MIPIQMVQDQFPIKWSEIFCSAQLADSSTMSDASCPEAKCLLPNQVAFMEGREMLGFAFCLPFQRVALLVLNLICVSKQSV